MNIIFKNGSEEDIPVLLELMSEFYVIEHLNYDSKILAKTLTLLFSNEMYGKLWIIFEDEKPIGYILVTFGFSLEFYGVDALVDEFYIRELYRGKGTGKQALKFIEDELIKHGVEAIHLEVDRQNVYAQEVYRKAGFKDHDRFLLTKWIKVSNE